MPLVDYEQITTSAPGRFILTGEFADLHEKNCIAMAIDCRLRVDIRPYKEGRLRLTLKNFGMIREWPTTSIGMNRLINKFGDCLEYTDRIQARLNHLLHKRYYQSPAPNDCPSPEDQSAPIGSLTRQADDATMAFLISYAALGDSFAKSARPPLDIVVSSEIPINKGLGSSSAYGVALIAALMKAFRVSAEPYVISNWASQIDKLFHKYTSNLSAITIIHGGYCYYQIKPKGYGIKHASKIKVMIIDTGEERHPRIINQHIYDLAKEDSVRVKNCFSGIGEIAGTIWKTISQPKFQPRSINHLLLANQDILDLIGIGHEKFRDLREKASYLRLSVKQTHCGNSAFILYDEADMDHNLQEFRNQLRETNITFRDYNICYTGLQVTKLPGS